MRILVYGAGVLGCELAHVLMQNKKNVVTLLARGEWKEMIDQKGLIIRHWVQRKTQRNGSKPWTLLPRMIIMISSLWSCRRASCRRCFLCSRPTRASILCLWAQPAGKAGAGIHAAPGG